MAGTEDLGRFVNNTKYFEPSAFDERAAMPVLLGLLPTLEEGKVVASVAGHLRRPWARPAAFEPLLAAFRRWAPEDALVGWHLGDALANAADETRSGVVVELCRQRQYGTARQMLVESLWRHRKDPTFAPLLTELLDDPDVALHAMSALRRAVGNESALPHLRQAAQSADPKIRRAATQAVKRAEKALRS